jgi:hypothetical protein
VGCRKLPEIYSNHRLEKDSLSYLNYDGTHLSNENLKIRNFSLDSNSIPIGYKKVEDKHLIDLFNHNIIINGYKQEYYATKSLYFRTGFFTKLLLKYNKHTQFEPDQSKPIDYQKYLSDSLAINEYYSCGQIEFSKLFKSYVLLNHRYRNNLDGFFFLKEETSYYLLNIDLSNKLISTIQLAYFTYESDGLSQFEEQLQEKMLLKHWLIFKRAWYIASLDISPPATNDHKNQFILRISKQGEIK